MSNSQPVIHPLFEECKKYVLDPFWKDQFTNFSYNRFPPGIRYDTQHNNLIIKSKNKKTEVIALKKNASEAFHIVMEILKTKFNMRSTRDLNIQKEEMNEVLKKRVCDLNCEWKKIKPRHLKDQLIVDFIASLKQKYNLSQSEVKNLISSVQLGFQFKSLIPDNVVYKNGIVTAIKGLKFNKNTRQFSTPKYPIPHVIKQDKNILPNKFYTYLDRFLKEDSIRTSKIECV